MWRQILTLFFLNIFLSFATTHEVADKEVLIAELEKKLDIKLFKYADCIVKWLENINNLNNSEMEKMIRYNNIQPKYDNTGSEARGIKKILPLVLIPIVFKIGAISTWMILTTFLAAKSVAIGLILLVFKIVVSTAKVASLLTIWKAKKYHSELSWPVHHDHHGHNEMFHQTYAPDWSSHPSVYKTVTTRYPEIEYTADKNI